MSKNPSIAPYSIMVQGRMGLRQATATAGFQVLKKMTPSIKLHGLGVLGPVPYRALR